MSDKPHDWPETLRLADIHQSEIVGWMQDLDGEADEFNHPGEYVRADLYDAQAKVIEAAEVAASVLDAVVETMLPSPTLAHLERARGKLRAALQESSHD